LILHQHLCRRFKRLPLDEGVRLTPEVVAAPEAGVLMPSLDAAGVVAGINQLFASMPWRADTRRYAEGFNWDATTKGQLTLFRNILARARN